MKRRDFDFQSSGRKIKGRQWTVDGATEVIVGIHGYSEHSLRYEPLVEEFQRKKWDVYFFDLPGHGESEGERSNIDDFSEYTQCVRDFLSHIPSYSKRFLFGHSLGGLIAIRFLQTCSEANQFSSAALSSPLLGLGQYSPKWLPWLKRLATILPNLDLPTAEALRGEGLTHDLDRLKSRLDDPSIKSKVTMHWLRESLRAREKAFEEVQLIKNPLAIFQAGDDKITDRHEAERFSKLLLCRHEFKSYAGWYHELSNEVGRASFFEDLWLWFHRTGI